MKNNKKSTVYTMFIFSLLIVVVIVPYAFIRATKVKNKFDKFIGESEIHILKTYEKGEKVLFYIDESARKAHDQILIKYIKENIDNPSCNKIGDSILYFDAMNNEPCIASFNFDKEGFIEEFNRVFMDSLDKYSEKIPNADYNFQVDGDSSITGTTQETLKIEINPDGKIRIRDTSSISVEEVEKDIAQSFEYSEKDTPELIGYYSVTPSFHIESVFDSGAMLKSIGKFYSLVSEKGKEEAENILREDIDFVRMDLCPDTLEPKNYIKICYDTGLYETKVAILESEKTSKFILKFALPFEE